MRWRLFGAGGALAGEESLEGVEEIAAREDSDEGAFVDYGQAAAFGLLHEGNAAEQRFNGGDRFRFAGHDPLDNGIGKDGVIGLLGDGKEARRGAALDIALGEEANEFVSVEDGQVANQMSAEEDSGVNERCGRRDCDHRCGHDIADEIFPIWHR